MIKKNWLLENAIYFYLLSYPLVVLLKYISMWYIVIEVLISFVFFFGALKDSHKRNLVITVVTFLVLVLGLAHSYYYYQKVGIFYNWVGVCIQLLLISFPWFLVGMEIGNFSGAYEQLKQHILPLLLSAAILAIYAGVAGKYVTSGNMAVSYALLPLWALIFDLVFQKKSVSNVALLAVITVFVIITGSRGPLLCFGVYFLLYMLIFSKGHKSTIFMMFFIMLFLVCNWQWILQTLYVFLVRNHIPSRTISKILYGGLLDDTGRLQIHSIIYQFITEHSIFGGGIGSERIALKNTNIAGNATFSSLYPHNIFLEVVSHFGILFGGILIILIVLLMVTSLFNKDKHFVKLSLIIGITECMHLTISSTYTDSPLFFLYIGILLSHLNFKKMPYIE